MDKVRLHRRDPDNCEDGQVYGRGKNENRTNHTCHQKPNTSRETVPLNDAGKQRGTAGGVASKEEENLQASRSRGTVHQTNILPA